MCKLTVFTATYNRAHLIEKLYRSLQRQSVFDFEWLVIDDGSSDETRILFEKWLKEDNAFSIRYYHQENQGLIRALNRGISLARGEYLAKIDSDDYIVDAYMENMLSWISSIEGAERVYAVSGLRVTPNGMPLKGKYPSIPQDPGYVDATDLQRKDYDLDADMSEAWKVEVLRRYPFPVWQNEKFAPEQLSFFQIALDGYKIRWFPVPMTICEYQEGGLTLGADILVKRNPMGYAMMHNQNMLIHQGLKRRFKDAAQMIALCSYAGHLDYLKSSNNKALTALAFPVGMLLGVRRRMQYAKMSD